MDLTYPGASDPDGYFQALPMLVQAEKRAFACIWHLRNFYTLRAIAEKQF